MTLLRWKDCPPINPLFCLSLAVSFFVALGCAENPPSSGDDDPDTDTDTNQDTNLDTNLDTTPESETDSDTGASSSDVEQETETDNCPDDAQKTEPGLCGCGTPEGTCGGEGDILLNLRVHIMREITMTVQGQDMDNDHITAEVVEDALMPELNKIWAPADIAWRVESIIEEIVNKPSNYEELKSIVENAVRDDAGHADPDRLPPLYSFMDPDHRSTQGELGTNLFHIYIFPFIGNTSQGNAMRSFGFHTVLGSWSNKSNGGRIPIQRQNTEKWSACIKGSLARTMAHELGHVLSLGHNQCTNCLMVGCGYSMTKSQIEDAQDEAKNRLQ